MKTYLNIIKKSISNPRYQKYIRSSIGNLFKNMLFSFFEPKSDMTLILNQQLGNFYDTFVGD